MGAANGMRDYAFNEIGKVGCQSTNQALIVVAGTTSLLPALGPGLRYMIYQIDVDVSGLNSTISIGDDAAIPGTTDNIVFYTSNNGHFTTVYPNGWWAGKNLPISALVAGSAANVWVRITYTTT